MFALGMNSTIKKHEGKFRFTLILVMQNIDTILVFLYMLDAIPLSLATGIFVFIWPPAVVESIEHLNLHSAMPMGDYSHVRSSSQVPLGYEAGYNPNNAWLPNSYLTTAVKAFS